jgi:uncharacterized protein YjcR
MSWRTRLIARPGASNEQPLSDPRKPDWAGAKLLFQQGMPNRAIARQLAVSETAVRKRAKRENWERTGAAAKKTPSPIQTHKLANMRCERAVTTVFDLC